MAIMHWTDEKRLASLDIHVARGRRKRKRKEKHALLVKKGRQYLHRQAARKNVKKSRKNINITKSYVYNYS